MTLIVGILCSDGVVMASDSAATLAAGATHTIGQQAVQKVRGLKNGTLLYSFTGAVGIGQLAAAELEAKWDGSRRAEVLAATLGKTLAQLIHPFLLTTQPLVSVMGPSAAGSVICKHLLAGIVNGAPALMQFSENGAPELASSELPFVALGSGQPRADPFLALLKRVLWPSASPTVREGTLAAVWAIQHVIQVDPGGVAGDVQLATLTTAGVNFESKDALGEHRQAIERAEQGIRNSLYGVAEQGEVDAAAPSIPAIEQGTS